MAGLRNVAIWQDTAVALVKARLAAVTGVDANYIYESDDEAKDSPATDQYLVVLMDPQSIAQGYVDGGGNTTPLIIGTVTVQAWSRLYVDQFQRADAFMGDAMYGIKQLARKVLKALQLFDPLNGSLDFQFAEPMRMNGFDRKPRTDKLDWGRMDSTYEISFLADLVS